jgi:hypothetical protein
MLMNELAARIIILSEPIARAGVVLRRFGATPQSQRKYPTTGLLSYRLGFFDYRKIAVGF